MPTVNHTLPWYREPWPWLLIAGPLAVVIACGATLWVAHAYSDALVVDDYYKAGKAINISLMRDARAREVGLSARMGLEGESVSLAVHSDVAMPLPAALRLLVTHATEREKDRVVLLHLSNSGRYQGTLVAISPGRYHLTLEDMERTWRLTGDWRAGEIEAGIAMRFKPERGSD
jgi:uncharacterized protein